MEFADSEGDERMGKLVGSASGAQRGASEMMYLTEEGPGGLPPMPWTTIEPAQSVEVVEQVVAAVLCSEVAGIGQSQDAAVVVDEGGNPAVDWSS